MCERERERERGGGGGGGVEVERDGRQDFTTYRKHQCTYVNVLICTYTHTDIHTPQCTQRAECLSTKPERGHSHEIVKFAQL